MPAANEKFFQTRGEDDFQWLADAQKPGCEVCNMQVSSVISAMHTCP